MKSFYFGILAILVAISFILTPVNAGEQVVDETVDESTVRDQQEQGVWDSIVDTTGNIVDKTVTGAERAWDFTKERSKAAADYTTEKAGVAWQATKDMASKTGQSVKNGYEVVKQKTKDVVE